MINSMDIEAIVKSTVDGFRVRVSHHRVSLSNEDLEALTHILKKMLEDYADNRHIQQNEYVPEKS